MCERNVCIWKKMQCHLLNLKENISKKVFHAYDIVLAMEKFIPQIFKLLGNHFPVERLDEVHQPLTIIVGSFRRQGNRLTRGRREHFIG